MKDTRDERGDPGLRAHPLQIDAKPIVASARWLQSQAGSVIAALIGTLAFVRVYGMATLNPTPGLADPRRLQSTSLRMAILSK